MFREMIMSEYDEQMQRWTAILGDPAEGTKEEALEAFFKHLREFWV